MHAALVPHQNGGLYLIDLKSSHHTFVDSKPLRPYQACLLTNGAAIVFGASSRTYRVGGSAGAREDDSDDEGVDTDLEHAWQIASLQAEITNSVKFRT